MKFFSSVVLIVIVGVILIFSMQNAGYTDISFLGWEVGLPKAVLVVIAYVLGMFTGWAVWSFLRRTYHRATEPKH